MDDEELDEEERDEQEDQEEQQESPEKNGPNPENAKDEVKQKIEKAKKMKEKIQKVQKAQKAAKKAKQVKAATKFASGAKKFALLANPYFWIAMLIILAIIVLIGLIMSFTIMPSNFLGKCKRFVEGMMQGFCGFIWGDNTSPISNGSEDVKDLANYIQDMGYDIQGYGFGDVEYEDEAEREEVKEAANEVRDNAIDGKRNYVTDQQATQGGKIKKVFGLQAVTTVSSDKYDDGDEMYRITGRFSSKNNDYLRAYLSAEAATYTEATYSIKGLFNELGDLISRTLDGIFGSNDTDVWQDPGDVGIKAKSTGMLNFTNSGGNNLFNSDLTGSPSKIKVDPKNKKLILYEKDLTILGFTIAQWGQTFSIDLSDWTAVYGRPLELFLALHLSSMMPDLPYQIAVDQAFNTKVNINLEDVKIYFDTTITLDGHRVTIGGDFGGAVSTIPGTGVTGLPPNVQACYNLWHSKGLSDVQIAAILGNAYRECGGVSNWDWNAQKSALDAGEDLKLGHLYGADCTLAGFLPGYGLEHLKNYAAAVGKDWSDATTQAEFIYYTLWGEYSAKCKEEKGDAAYQIILDFIKGSGTAYMTTAQWKNYSGQYPYDSSFRDATSPSSAAWAYFICYEGMQGYEDQAHFCRECAEYWYERIQNSAESLAEEESGRLFFIGDSWIYGTGYSYGIIPGETYGVDSSNSNIVTGENYYGWSGAGTWNFTDSVIQTYDNASAIVICLGLNCTATTGNAATDNAYDMARVIRIVQEKNPGKTIYITQTPHVGRNTWDTKNPVDWNNNIDAYNSVVRSLCDGTEVIFINPNDVITDSEGYLRDDYSGGGFHLSEEGYRAWYNKIVSCIGNENGTNTNGNSNPDSSNLSLADYLPSANTVRKEQNYQALKDAKGKGDPVQVSLIDDDGEVFTVTLSQDDLKNLLKLIESGTKGANIKWPNIESVTNHWYYHIIDFYGTAAENTPYGTYKKAKVAKKTIKYSDEDGNLDNYDIELTALLTSDSGIYYQVCEPYLNRAPSKYLKTIFHGAYYKYDGTTETARKIAAARAIEAAFGTDDANDTNFPQSTEEILNKHIKYNWHSSDSDSSKIEVSGEDAEEYISAKQAQVTIKARSDALIRRDNLYQEEGYDPDVEKINEELEEGKLEVDQMGEESPMCKKLVDFKSDKSNTLEAFSILENVNSEAAEVNYRLLKKLMVEMDYFTEDEMNSHEKNILLWITNVEGVKGEDVAVTINKNLGQTDNGKNKTISDTSRDANEYGVVISNFMENTKIIAPGDAKVKEVGTDGEKGDYIELEFTTLTDKKVYPYPNTMMLLHQDNEQDPYYNIETPYEDEPIYSAAEVMRRYRFRETYQVFENDDVVGITMKISGLHDIRVSVGDTVLRGDEIAGTPRNAVEGEEDSGDKIYVSMKKPDKTKVENVEDYIDPVYTFEDEKDMAKELWYLDHPEYGNVYKVTKNLDYVEYAKEMAANDDMVGYSGPYHFYMYNSKMYGSDEYKWDVDCGSLVFYSLQETGWDPAKYMGYQNGVAIPFEPGYHESEVLIQLGFTEHIFTGYQDCEYGDILYNSGHTEIYCGTDGENKTVGAHHPTDSIPSPFGVGWDDAAGHGDQSDEVTEGAAGSSWEKYYRPPAGVGGNNKKRTANLDYIQWALDIIEDGTYYYGHNSDPKSYSCSTFVADAMYCTGVFPDDISPSSGAAIGGEGGILDRYLLQYGFEKIYGSEMGGFEGLEVGDVFVVSGSNMSYHIAIYVGDGKAAGAIGSDGNPVTSNNWLYDSHLGDRVDYVYRPTAALKSSSRGNFGNADFKTMSTPLYSEIEELAAQNGVNSEYLKIVIGTTANEGYVNDPYLYYGWASAMINNPVSIEQMQGWDPYHSGEANFYSRTNIINGYNNASDDVLKAVKMAFTNRNPKIIECNGMYSTTPAGYDCLYQSSVYNCAIYAYK